MAVALSDINTKILFSIFYNYVEIYNLYNNNNNESDVAALFKTNSNKGDFFLMKELNLMYTVIDCIYILFTYTRTVINKMV